MMSARDRGTANFVSPSFPDCNDVTVKVRQIVSLRPESRQWTANPAALGKVLAIMLGINAQARAVIFGHRVNGGRVAYGANEVREILLAHRFRGTAVPRKRVGSDRALGLLWLGVKKPMPPASGKIHATTVECLQDRNTVKDG
jgi:hypothetical protein